MSENVTRANTELDNFLASMPGEVADVISWLLTPFRELLEYVSGDPDDLIRAAQVWADAAADIEALRQEQAADVAAVRQHWSDDAATAFEAQMADFDTNLSSLIEAVDGTKELLVQSANAAVEAFNLLLQLIIELILWLMTDLILAFALSVVTFGASVAAGIAKATADAAIALGRGIRIVEKLASLLMKISRFLLRIAEFARNYRALILAMRELKKGSSLLSAEGAYVRAVRAGVLMPGRVGFNVVSPVDLPGLTTIGKDIFTGVGDLLEDPTG